MAMTGEQMHSMRNNLLALMGVRQCECDAGIRPQLEHWKADTHTLHNVQRADPEKLKVVFEKYASHTDQFGQKFMTRDDFVRNYLQMYIWPNYNRQTVAFIAGAADTTKDGLISFDEFAAFEAVLCAPDALYEAAFEMFDTNGSEAITFQEFKEIIKHTESVHEMDFDFDSNFIKRYFGNDKDHAISYFEFCQLLHDFHDEQSKQAFRKYDKNNAGSISLEQFVRIMSSTKAHLLTDFVRDHLAAVAGEVPGKTENVTFAYFNAFSSLLSKIEMFKRIYLHAAKGILTYQMSQDEFLTQSQSFAQITPFEVEILFRIAQLQHPGHRYLAMRDFEKIDPERLKRQTYLKRITDIKVVDSPDERGAFAAILEQMYRFALGSVAGACGATAVYPIDLVKTRMQNQRSGSFIGEIMYKNSFDCFKKVLRHEGFTGLYRGLLPQIVGVAPEKAIKLTMNDLMRDQLRFEGRVPLWGEIVAGGCAGASQVVFTNPLEIVKIRLQVAGEIQSAQKISVFTIIKELGLRGLYKGARACFLRDVPFSAIYFPTYAHMKQYTADENGHCGVGSLFISAFIAGVPAAGLVTPADVIKTRLQVAARAGQTTYTGLFDCYQKILKEEGWTALWKGSAARVCRSSPQFGVTLLCYELMQRVFYVDFGGSKPIGSEAPSAASLVDQSSTHPDHIGGYALATATFQGIGHKFGLRMPRFELRQQPEYHQASKA